MHIQGMEAIEMAPWAIWLHDKRLDLSTSNLTLWRQRWQEQPVLMA
jgi:hypothetical protein